VSCAQPSVSADDVSAVWITGSPDIAFEVVSSDPADRLQFKISAYPDHGSKAVSCIYPPRNKSWSGCAISHSYSEWVQT